MSLADTDNFLLFFFLSLLTDALELVLIVAAFYLPYICLMIGFALGTNTGWPVAGWADRVVSKRWVIPVIAVLLLLVMVLAFLFQQKGLFWRFFGAIAGLASGWMLAAWPHGPSRPVSRVPLPRARLVPRP
jgi:hypothetical protein